MKRKTLHAIAALACAFVGACATPPAPPQSLRGAEPGAADAAFTEPLWIGKRPGSQEVYARTYSTQPPLIPHALENFDEVTLTDHQCLECHGPANAKKKNAPQLNAKHLAGGDTANLANATSAGSRHACVMCHVPQSDAKPLVGNAFQGDRTVPAPARQP